MQEPAPSPTSVEAQPASELAAHYRAMLLIRRVEEALATMFADGEIPGFIHLSVGQEAIAVGVNAALRPTDTIASTHRGHGHAIAKGIALPGFFLELMGKQGGICGGRGGSMHVADMSVGMLGANGIVGAGVPIAVGSALAHQIAGERNIAAVFFGDGAMAEGALHEGLNLASLWRLPLLFVCENNGWSEFSPTDRQFAAKLGDLAAAFKIPAEGVDGNDVEAVAAAAARIVRDMREGGGPRVLECITRRIRGHFEGDPQKYRQGEELHGRDEADPIGRCAARLRETGLNDAALERIAGEVDQLVQQATAAARAAPEADFQAALADVYTPAPVH